MASRRGSAEANTEHQQLVVTPTDEGAATHAIGTSLSLMSQLVFDWLDEVFGDTAVGEPENEQVVMA